MSGIFLSDLIKNTRCTFTSSRSFFCYGQREGKKIKKGHHEILGRTTIRSAKSLERIGHSLFQYPFSIIIGIVVIVTDQLRTPRLLLYFFF